MRLSNIANWRQQSDGECLAACAAMVINYLSKQANYAQLLQRLDTTDAGTPFSNIVRLNSWWLTVELAQGQVVTLRQQLEKGNPIIVPVATELLPYWLVRSDRPTSNWMTEHAIVVIGIDNHSVYVNDPDFDDTPQMVDMDWFKDAWGHHNYRYAVIRRRRFYPQDIKSYIFNRKPSIV